MSKSVIQTFSPLANGKRKFAFLGLQTLNGTRRLLFSNRAHLCIGTKVSTYIYKKQFNKREIPHQTFFICQILFMNSTNFQQKILDYLMSIISSRSFPHCEYRLSGATTLNLSSEL
jgi:hypothetical protein